MSFLPSKDGAWQRPDSRVWWPLPSVTGAASGEGRTPAPPTPNVGLSQLLLFLPGLRGLDGGCHGWRSGQTQPRSLQSGEW